MSEPSKTKDILAAIRGQAADPNASPTEPRSPKPKPAPKPKAESADGAMSSEDKLAAIRGGVAAEPRPKAAAKSEKPAIQEPPMRPAAPPPPWPATLLVVLLGWIAFTLTLIAWLLVSDTNRPPAGGPADAPSTTAPSDA